MITKESFKKEDAWGLSAMVDLYKCDPNILRSETRAREYMIAFVIS